MTDEEREAGLASWLLTRPECVQRLAAEFPFGQIILVGGRRMQVMGWTENDTVIVFDADRFTSYDDATANREHLHASCIRDAH